MNRERKVEVAGDLKFFEKHLLGLMLIKPGLKPVEPHLSETDEMRIVEQRRGQLTQPDELCGRCRVKPKRMDAKHRPQTPLVCRRERSLPVFRRPGAEQDILEARLSCLSEPLSTMAVQTLNLQMRVRVNELDGASGHKEPTR